MLTKFVNDSVFIEDLFKTSGYVVFTASLFSLSLEAYKTGLPLIVFVVLVILSFVYFLLAMLFAAHRLISPAASFLEEKKGKPLPRSPVKALLLTKEGRLVFVFINVLLLVTYMLITTIVVTSY